MRAAVILTFGAAIATVVELSIQVATPQTISASVCFRWGPLSDSLGQQLNVL